MFSGHNQNSRDNNKTFPRQWELFSGHILVSVVQSPELDFFFSFLLFFFFEHSCQIKHYLENLFCQKMDILVLVVIFDISVRRGRLVLKETKK